jgi:hypothetical protein
MVLFNCGGECGSCRITPCDGLAQTHICIPCICRHAACAHVPARVYSHISIHSSIQLAMPWNAELKCTTDRQRLPWNGMDSSLLLPWMMRRTESLSADSGWI